ncbi:SDR family oxidoreductase [Streptomyces indonesiensis]
MGGAQRQRQRGRPRHDPHRDPASGRARRGRHRRAHPLRPARRPADIVGPVLFLASPAADYINGQTVVVDGGWLSYGYL